jgi:hypothetical protein
MTTSGGILIMPRPKKPPPKVKNVQVRFSMPQYATLVESAHYYGVEVAVYCRLVVMRAVTTKDGPEELRLRGIPSTDADPGRTAKKNARRAA